MKYLHLTYVDAVSGYPVTEQTPAHNGPVIPDGVQAIFARESSRSSSSPDVYGIAADDFSVPDWMEEIDEGSLLELYRHELSDRLRAKRAIACNSGFSTDAGFQETDDVAVTRISAALALINADETLKVCHIERATGEILRLSRGALFELARSVFAFRDSVLSWTYDVAASIQAATTIEEAAAIETNIACYEAGNER